ncbi:hypothetical protein CN934_09940 [Ensifer sp. MMN_5]|jgi:hypothetical protein|nr:hypothetical protein CN934_09940 [Ensifer sp. MMN_5]
MLVLQGSPFGCPMASAAPIDYIAEMKNYRRITMSSQRQLAKHARSSFLLQLWSAMMRVQTRETAALFSSRQR